MLRQGSQVDTDDQQLLPECIKLEKGSRCEVLLAAVVSTAEFYLQTKASHQQYVHCAQHRGWGSLKYSIAECFYPKVFVNCLQAHTYKQFTKIFPLKQTTVNEQ